MGEIIEFCSKTSCYQKISTIPVSVSNNCTKKVCFANIIHDIALLRSLGVKLVLVHGARPQIEERMEQRNITRNIENNILKF